MTTISTAEYLDKMVLHHGFAGAERARRTERPPFQYGKLGVEDPEPRIHHAGGADFLPFEKGIFYWPVLDHRKFELPALFIFSLAQLACRSYSRPALSDVGDFYFAEMGKWDHDEMLETPFRDRAEVIPAGQHVARFGQSE